MSTASSSASSNPPAQDTSMAESFFNSLTSPTLWSEKDVKNWLATVGFADIADISEENGIDGAVLMHLDSESLRDLGIIKVGRRLRLIRLINDLERSRHGLATSRHGEFSFTNAATHLKLESQVYEKFSNQSERISQLEEELWQLRALTDSLRERSNSATSFKLNWTAQPSHNQTDVLLPSMKASAVKPRWINAHPLTKSLTHPPPVVVTRPLQKAHDQSGPLTSESELCPPAILPTKPDRRRSNSGANEVKVDQDSSTNSFTSPFPGEPGSSLVTDNSNLTPKIRHQFPSNSQTHPATLINPWSRNPTATPTTSLKRQSSHSLMEFGKKLSNPNFDLRSASDLSPAIQTPRARANTSTTHPGLIVARKPSLLTRSPRPTMMGGSGGTPPSHSCSLNYMSPSKMTDGIQETEIRSQVKNKSYGVDGVDSVNRSASTSKLRTAHSTPLFEPLPNAETSVRVKSNNAETVIEVLIGHLSSFYLDDPHAWSKHVLIVRKQQSNEYCLSYDEIPLKIYRSFKSREGIDFAIRSIDELLSPLRSVRPSRRRENGPVSCDAMAVGDTAEGEEDLDAARRPLPFGLAICGHRSDIPDELSIKPGHTFRIKEQSKTRYLVERDCSSVLSTSPLSGITSSASSLCSASPSPTRTINSSIDFFGWVPKACILEMKQTISSMAPNGTHSLKDLISKPIKTSDDIFDQNNLTTPKISLITFQTPSLNWSGEMPHLRQGEILRAFNFKTRLHWTYCLRESTGERGWCPNWILSSNLQVFAQGPVKLLQYLGDQQSSISPFDRTVGNDQDAGGSEKTTGSFRSRSLRSPRGPSIGVAKLAVRPTQANEDTSQSTGMKSTLQRSVTDGAMRAMHFTPRSRRSRINPMQS